MTTRSRILALSMAALMVTTTVVSILPAATAQDAVPTAPGVTFTVVPDVEHKFYLRFANPQTGGSTQPACPGPLAPAEPTLQLDPAAPGTEFGGRASCAFSANGATVRFVSDPGLRPKRPVTFTGNVTSLVYTHTGTVPDGVRISVVVKSGDSTIATGSFEGVASGVVPASSRYVVPLTIVGITGRVTMAKDLDVVVELTANADADGALGAGTPSWTLSDVDSYLSLQPDDSVRAATWVTDERSALRTVFSPIAQDSQRLEDQDRRIVGHFALQSAFGYTDASRGEAARFRVFLSGQPREIGPGGATVIIGTLNQSASAPANGTAVWSFPANTLRYNGAPPGEYTLHADKDHHQGSAITAGLDRVFSIAAQSIDLRVYADTRTGMSESQAHTVQPGSSTTYVLQVNNTGSVNDTYTVNFTAPNAPTGWGAGLGGPDLQGTRIFVPKGETRVFTLRVDAPLGATGQIIHLVNVTSTLDPGVRSRDLTLVTSVGTELIREVGVIFLARNLELEPGVETHFPVYVWNRGTRPANISLQLKETTVGTWTADLAFGNANVDIVPMGGIQAGNIAEARLKVRGESAASPSHTITLNVTHQDVAGVSAERAVTFTLRLTSGVTIRVLDEIDGHGHIAELQTPTTVNVGDGAGGSPQTAPNPACSDTGGLGADCTPDGIDGLWYRAWVTNNGRNSERFTMTAELFDSNCDRNEGTAFFDTDLAPPAALGFYHRNAAGTPSSGATVLDLAPGQTGEVYFLMPVNREADPCGGDTDVETVDFVIQARGDTGVIARQQLRASATNDGGAEAVLIEPVARLNYDAQRPIVDVANATKSSILGGIRPGGEIFYYVRVTNAASWGNWTDTSGTTPVRRTSDLRLRIDGVDLTAGWNVSMRPVDGDLNSEQMREDRNPFRREYNLTNIEPGTNLLRAWIDKEIQVRVQAPSIANGTAVTFAQDSITLRASMNGSDTASSIEVVTVVTDFAQVNVRTDVPRVYAHPGDPSAFLLYLNNSGGSETPVTMRATMQNAPAGWQVEPNAQTFSLAAFKNRTIALRVTPPAGAAPGTTATVGVNVSYVEFPKLGTNATRNSTLPITVEVVGPGTLQLNTGNTETTVAPGGFANFTMTLRNTGSLSVPFRVSASDIPNWTVTASPEFGNLSASDQRTITLVARVPGDVTNESRFSSIVRVEDISSGAAGTQNFDTAAFTINILGGRAIPSISVPNLVKRVDRGGAQNFEVGIRNIGSAAGRIPLEFRALDPTWSVALRSPDNATISSVFLGPNEQVNVLVNVSAPFVVPERTVVPVEIAAYTPDLTQRATATLSAEIHDYGVQLVLAPSSKDGLPGLATEFVARVRNTGNDNDTLNLSVNLIDLPGWSVDAVRDVTLEPNQETEIRMTFRSPIEPLPTPRAYTFPVWVGTRGGQAVNITKNMTQSAVITIPNYRAFDMDGDAQLEIAVDLDKRTGNGFEEFREIFVAGEATREIGTPIFDGRTTFLLDVPAADRPHDGVADIWFNPETVHAFPIEHAPDINGDGTPDYLLDTDRDGEIDRAYDSVTERFWNVVEVKIYDDERIQYLVDVTGDGRPDRFYDPEAAEGAGLVTRTQDGGDLGDDYVGIDVDDDQTVDYYYNTRTERTSGAEVGNLGGFAARYWYFFVAFAVLVLVSIVLIVRRRRA